MSVYKRTRKCDGIESWYLDFLIEGRRRRECIGPGTKTWAKAQLAVRLQEARSGAYVSKREARAKAEAERQAETTLGEFVKRFDRDYATGIRSDHYDDRLPPLVKRLGANTPLRAITVADLDRYKAERLKEVSPSTVRKDLAVLTTLFKKAEEWDVITVNPMRKIKKPRQPKKPIRYLSVEEWGRLEKTAPPLRREFYRFAVATGLRLGEMVKLRWSDLDPQAAQLHVAQDTKTGTRPVPLSPSALAVLSDRQRYRFRSPFVFTDDGGEGFDNGTGRTYWSRYTSADMRGAGIQGASFKTLRATAGSWMVQEGVELYEVSRLLGHSSVDVTQAHYAHLAPGHLKRGTDALDRVIRGLEKSDTQSDTCSPGIERQHERDTA